MKNKIVSIIIAALITGLTTGFATSFATALFQTSVTERKTAEIFSEHLDPAGKEMSFEDMLEVINEDLKKAKDENVQLTKQLEEAQNNNTAIDESTLKLIEIENSYPKKLSELVLVASENYEQTDGLFTDSYGNTYSISYAFLGSSFAVYNLKCNYSNFSLKIMTSPDTFNDSVFIIEVYADDEMIYAQDNITKLSDLPSLSLSVMNAKTLTIKVKSTNSSLWGDTLYLSEATVS